MDVRAPVLAGVRQFLAQPLYAHTPELLLTVEVGGLTVCREECSPDNPSAAIVFRIADSKGTSLLCRCSPVAFALLLLIMVYGQTAFIDYSGVAGKPYLKVFGRNEASAGTVFGRIIAGLEDGETAEYVNGDTLDFTHPNVIRGRASSRARRDTPDWYGETLKFASALPSELFGGQAGEKLGAAKAVLDLARERLHEERDAALAAIGTA